MWNPWRQIPCLRFCLQKNSGGGGRRGSKDMKIKWRFRWHPLKSLFPETPEGLGAQVLSYLSSTLDLCPWEWVSWNLAWGMEGFWKFFFSDLFHLGLPRLATCLHIALGMCLAKKRLVPFLWRMTLAGTLQSGAFLHVRVSLVVSCYGSVGAHLVSREMLIVKPFHIAPPTQSWRADPGQQRVAEGCRARSTSPKGTSFWRSLIYQEMSLQSWQEVLRQSRREPSSSFGKDWAVEKWRSCPLDNLEIVWGPPMGN